MDSMEPLWVISMIFCLSLLGAWVLFRLLGATAVVKTAKYKAGGAAAGFVIVYGTLYGSYYQIAKDYRPQMTVEGSLSPAPARTQVILAVAKAEPEDDGSFSLKAPWLDPKDTELAIYVVSEDRHVWKKVRSTEEMKGKLKIRTEALGN